jgi:hypothetical protein
MLVSKPSRSSVSETRIREFPTGVDAVGPMTRSGQHDERARSAWQQVIDRTLMSWLRDPGQLEDEGIDAPSGAIIRQSIDLAEAFRDSREYSYPAPDCVIPDPNGGIIFERRVANVKEVVHIWDDGLTEYMRFEGTRLVERGPYWPE